MADRDRLLSFAKKGYPFVKNKIPVQLRVADTDRCLDCPAEALDLLKNYPDCRDWGTAID